VAFDPATAQGVAGKVLVDGPSGADGTWWRDALRSALEECRD
jgi:hypothetical protein